jgi:hypothetical protein
MWLKWLFLRLIFRRVFIFPLSHAVTTMDFIIPISRRDEQDDPREKTFAIRSSG